MMLRTLVAPALVASALALAACGEDAPGAADSSTRDQNREAMLKFASCMRDQGVDFPDPPAGGGPMRLEVGGDVTPEEMRKAEQACEKYRKDLKGPELSAEEEQEMKDAALEHSRCMREHGIDFPDPTFTKGGGARIKLGPGGVDPEDPDFQAAEKACGGAMNKFRQERKP